MAAPLWMWAKCRWRASNMYYYELHMHTSDTSRCGKSPAADMVAAYKQKGFTGVVVTDHLMNVQSHAEPETDWNRRVEKQLAGYYAALEAGEKLGLTVYCGWELTYQDNAEDYLTLGLSPQFLYDHPWLERYDIEKYRDAVHAAGGILVRAHPYRRAWYIKKPYVEREGIADAIEVFNGGNSSQEENDMALAYAQKHNMPMTGGSDAHHVDETARGYIALEKKAESYAELCEAIRTGKAIVMHK